MKDQFVTQQNELEKKLRASQEHSRRLHEDAEEARVQLSSRDRKCRHEVQEVEKKHTTLQETLIDLRRGLDDKSLALQSTQDTLFQRTSEVEILEAELVKLKAQAGDVNNLSAVKRELSDQVAHLRSLEKVNREQNTELKHLRRVHKAVEIVGEEKRALQNKVGEMDDLRRELGEAQFQRKILEDERNAWAAYLQNAAGGEGHQHDSPESLARAFREEKMKNASLIERLGAVHPELIEKDEMIKNIDAERLKLISELNKLKAGGGGSDSRIKSRLERQKTLAVKEVEYLRQQLRTFENEDNTGEVNTDASRQSRSRIEDLELLLSQQRTEIQNLNDELLKPESNPSSHNLRTLKRLHVDDSDERLGQVLRKNNALQSNISTLQQAHALLQSEHHVTKSQLSSLQSTVQTRVLALRSNPTSDFQSIKLSTITTLRNENKSLLAQLKGAPRNIESVPASTLDAAHQEISELKISVADKEKRMLRLKQIWSLKSLEFREAVASLLGWKMEFMPNGRFRMTSIFNSASNTDDATGDGNVDDQNSFIFDGDSGTMKISGGPESEFAAEIRGLVDFWIQGKKEIPAFLAAYTLEFYEKTIREQST